LGTRRRRPSPMSRRAEAARRPNSSDRCIDRAAAGGHATLSSEIVTNHLSGSELAPIARPRIAALQIGVSQHVALPQACAITASLRSSPHAHRTAYPQAPPPMVQPHIDRKVDLPSTARIFRRGRWHRFSVVYAQIDPSPSARDYRVVSGCGRLLGPCLPIDEELPLRSHQAACRDTGR
jgi:hypothetical protein